MKSDLIPHNVPVKRKPVPLKIKCPVCERPAPDHLHFGGPKMNNAKVLKSILQAKAATHAEDFSEGFLNCQRLPLSANLEKMTASGPILERNV